MSSGMFGGKKKKRNPEDDEMDITPMIDCTFLLLIFFMVTSSMKPEGSLRPPTAKHGAGIETKNAVMITIFDDDGTPAAFLSDGKRENPCTPEQVTAHVREKSPEMVIIKADRYVQSGFVEEIARAANDTDRENVKFYIAVKDKS
ncbi:MAG: biopolymer transporter ExbD [Planctomycetaceae bacterium]